MSEAKQIEISISPNTVILGPRCECGHTITAEASTKQRAKAKSVVKRVLHRVRHPLRERDSPREIMIELEELY